MERIEVLFPYEVDATDVVPVRRSLHRYTLYGVRILAKLVPEVIENLGGFGRLKTNLISFRH